jgi:hypothetical protein
MSLIKAIRNAILPRTAEHEVGHAIIAGKVGLKVHKVELLHGGRAGCTTLSGKVDKDLELQVVVAGFVAEELALGNTGLVGFNKGQYAQDLQEAIRIAGTDLLGIQAAIKADVEYLTRADIAMYAKYLTGVLNNKGVFDGALVQVS